MLHEPSDVVCRVRHLWGCLTWPIAVLLTVGGPACFAEAQQTAKPFETNAMGTPAGKAPVVEPWRVVAVDAEFGGHWVVAGDVNADGRVEIVSAQNFNQDDRHFTSAAVAQRLDGSVLWRWGDPKLGRRGLHHDVACQIHDLDRDGTSEVILAADEKIVVLDGPTGKVRRSFPIPKHASDCVAFADLSGAGWPSDVLVKTRYGQIWAYTAGGKLLWTVPSPGGYRTAHQPRPVDLDGDGRDEILAGYAALNPDGSVRWVFQAEPGRKNAGHADCWRVVRLAQAAENTRLVMTMCGGDALVMTDGNGKLLWKRVGRHYESVDVGKVCADVPGLQLVVDVDHLRVPKKPLCLFDERGELLGSINTDYTRHHVLVDWGGDGCDEIGSALPRGLFNGRGRRVATFAVGPNERPSIMAAGDVTGDGADDVLLTTTGDSAVYKVYLYKNTSSRSAKSRPPAGTGCNFTLY
ncbi:MAG: hypothetical protein ACYTG0_28480 [Planctomycetota bacterium]|jgi:hypothetical protein